MTRRLFPHPGLSGLLVIVWLLLINSVTFGAVLIALLVGWLVPLFTAPYWREKPLLRFGWPFVGYLAILLWDIAVANFQVAWIVLFRRDRDLRARWLVVPLEIRSPEAITALAGTISLTPGTVSADIAADGRSILVHALDSADPQADIARIKSRYEARLQEIFPVIGTALPIALAIAFGAIALAILLAAWRLFHGPTRGDRILALDTMTINAIALIVVLGVQQRTQVFFEAALLLAMVGFVGTVAYAKFLLRGDIVE